MRTQHLFPQEQRGLERLSFRVVEAAEHPFSRFARQAPIGVLLLVALLAFEIFNFDTTRFALINLMGEMSFAGLRWASILALAFCAIDFAGLAHLFAPGRQGDLGGETWYLMGAWVLGATMNALMTWWAVSLTLLNHELGNELLSREQLLELVPPFVAALVWVTRILFIGAFSVAGTHFFQQLELENDGVAGIEYEDAEPAGALQMEALPLRDRTQFIPRYDAADFRPIARGPRAAPSALMARGRRRS